MIRAAGLTDLPSIAAIGEAAYRPSVARIGREQGPLLDGDATLVGFGSVGVVEIGSTSTV